jgi:hypothetical protein
MLFLAVKAGGEEKLSSGKNFILYLCVFAPVKELIMHSIHKHHKGGP